MNTLANGRSRWLRPFSLLVSLSITLLATVPALAADISIFDFAREAPQPSDPAATPAAKVVQVLKLVDEASARVNKFQFHDGVLVTHNEASARMTLPYAPAAEFDLGVDFVRTSGNEDFAITFPVGRSNCTLSMGGRLNTAAWLGEVKGVWGEDANPTVVPLTLENDRHYRVVVSVRRDGIKTYLDGKLLCEYATDGHDVCGHHLFKARSARLLVVGGYRSVFEIHAVDVANLSGDGTAAAEKAEDGRPISPLAVVPGSGGAYELAAPDATAHGSGLLFQRSLRAVNGVDENPRGLRNYGGWNDPKDYVSWIVDVKQAGEFVVTLTYACPPGREGSEVAVSFDGEAPLPTTTENTGGWHEFRTVELGTVELPAGKVTIALKVTHKAQDAVMDVESIVLTPKKAK